MKIYVIKKNNEIIAWSSKKMSSEEVEVEITEQQYKELLASQNSQPMPSGEVK